MMMLISAKWVKWVTLKKRIAKEEKKRTYWIYGYTVTIWNGKIIADGAGNFAFLISHMKIVSIAREKQKKNNNNIREAGAEIEVNAASEEISFLSWKKMVVRCWLCTASKTNVCVFREWWNKTYLPDHMACACVSVRYVYEFYLLHV